MKGYFYVGSSLCSLQKSNIFCASAVFNMDICHIFPRCVLTIIPLIGVVTDVMMTTGCSAGPPICCVVIPALSPAGFSPQFWGVEACRSISQLWCEIGGNAALLLGEKPLSIPLPDQATRRCTLGVTCCMDSQSTLLLALPPAPPYPWEHRQSVPVSLRHYAQKAQIRWCLLSHFSCA